jgi:hypothetical protein
VFVSGTRVGGLAPILFAFACASCGPQPPFTVSKDGFGPVKLGMTVSEAEKLLGVRLEKDTYNDDDGCRYYTPVKGYRGLSFMTSLGKIIRIDVYGAAELDDTEKQPAPVTIATEEGAKTGDNEPRVLALYKGRIKVSPHFYGGPPSHYFRVYDEAGEVRLIFETDGAVITSYRAGHEAEVEYVEGCQ